MKIWVPPAFVWGTVKGLQLFKKDISCPGRDSNRRSPEQEINVTTGAHWLVVLTVMYWRLRKNQLCIFRINIRIFPSWIGSRRARKTSKVVLWCKPHSSLTVRHVPQSYFKTIIIVLTVCKNFAFCNQGDDPNREFNSQTSQFTTNCFIKSCS
jgi:hypothetical protein